MFGMRMSAAWASLAEKLRSHDRWGHFVSNADHPVSTLVNGGVSAMPCKHLLIQALDWPMERNELLLFNIRDGPLKLTNFAEVGL